MSDIELINGLHREYGRQIANRDAEIERLTAALQEIAEEKSEFGLPTDTADIARAALEGKP